jgi:hypothetical protein
MYDANGGEFMDGDEVALRTARTQQFLSDQSPYLFQGYQMPPADRPYVGRGELWYIYNVFKPGQPIRSGDTVRLASTRGLGDLGPAYWTWHQLGILDRPSGFTHFQFLDKHDTLENRNNCVLYVRSRVPSTPRVNLTDFGDIKTRKYGKVSIINVFSSPGVIDINAAKPGDVAVISTGDDTGHVAVVEQRHGDGTITIREGNFPEGTIRARRKTPNALKIVGYFRP